MNYRFYDATLAFVNENFHNHMRLIATLKNQQNVRRNNDDADLKGKLIELIGLKKKNLSEKKIQLPVFERNLSTF